MYPEISEKTRNLVKRRVANFDDLSERDKAIEAIRVVNADFYIYMERNLMILHKQSGEVVPLISVLTPIQRKFIDMVLSDIYNGIPVRYIILKARQLGFSTIIEALAYWWTATHKSIRSNIMAHEAQASTNLYEMFKRYYDHSFPIYKPVRKYNNKQELVFDISDKEKEEAIAKGNKVRGLGGSTIKTTVAKRGKGRSSTTHFFHGSEVAFWEDAPDVVAAAMQSIPLAPNTFSFLESTANGVGGYFYAECMAAMRGESQFKFLFFAWHEHDEYEIPGECSDYDHEEKKLLKLFKKLGYAEESWNRKILWRRQKKKEFRYEPEKFYQEYPSTPREAFIASGRPVFHVETLAEMEDRAMKITPQFGHVIPNIDTRSPNRYVFEPSAVFDRGIDPSPLKVFEMPIPGEKYTIGGDVSDGKLTGSESKKPDYSVLTVIKNSDLSTVARWRGHIDPDVLGSVAYNLGMFYNTALMGIEVNNHGLTTVQSLRNKNYSNLYHRETSEDLQFQERTSLLGWLTTKKTKPLIVDNLGKAIRDGDIIDLDVVFIQECMTFVRDDSGKTTAQVGCYDDTVMSTAIALWLTDYNSMSVSSLREKLKYTGNNNATREINFDAIIDGKTKPRRRYSEIINKRKTARKASKERKARIANSLFR